MDSPKPLETGEVKAHLKKLVQQTLQEALESELDEFLGYSKYQRKPADNSRNGKATKSLQTENGEIELQVPRDRKSQFEPKIVKKRQTVLEDLQDKIIAMYSKGMTTRDIQDFVQDMYGIEISPSLISRLTDRLLPRIEEWQSRPLKEVYVMAWLDCLFYKIREENKVMNKAIYVIIGLSTDGHKDILGFWISQKESSSFWLGVLNDLKSRGVRDVFIFSMDGLAGFEPAIHTVYPQAEVQQCVVHQIRNTLRYVAWKDRRELSQDLKTIYGAATLEEAQAALNRFDEKWSRKYPHVLKSWRANWDRLMTYFRYPVEIRKLMYTTNLIESVNSKFRKASDARRVFPSNDAILKVLYMAAMELERKWTTPIRDWPLIYAQLMILFEGRLS